MTETLERTEQTTDQTTDQTTVRTDEQAGRRDGTAPAGARRTQRQQAEEGWTAPQRLTDNLQQVLVDLIELHIQGKQAHWNVVGTNFRDLHLQLDEIVDAAREFSDDVAERLRALHATPDGRTDTIAATTTLPVFPEGEQDTSDVVDLVTRLLDGVVGTIRTVHDDVDEDDPTSADILHGQIERLEQFSWFVSSENRSARKR